MFKTTLFILPITFRRKMISHQEDCTQRSIDLIALELAQYDRSPLTLFDKKVELYNPLRIPVNFPFSVVQSQSICRQAYINIQGFS